MQSPSGYGFARAKTRDVATCAPYRNSCIVHYCLSNCWAGDRIHSGSRLRGHQADISVCTRDRNKLRKAARHCKSRLCLGLQRQEYKYSKHVRACLLEATPMQVLQSAKTVRPTHQQMLHQAIAFLKSNGTESVCRWPTSQMVERFLAHCRQLPQLRIKGTATRSPTWPFWAKRSALPRLLILSLNIFEYGI